MSDLMQNFQISLKINFYDKNVVSVDLLNNLENKKNEYFGEILLFCRFALRQMVNLGRHPSTMLIVTFLSEINTNAIINSKNNINNLQLINYKLYEYEMMMWLNNLVNVKIVNYQGYKAKKRFDVKLDIQNNVMSFTSKAIGFGFLARNIDFYASVAIMATLKYLTKKHFDDYHFLSKISLASNLCSDAFNFWDLNIVNQQDTALKITYRVIARTELEELFDKYFQKYIRKTPKKFSREFLKFIDKLKNSFIHYLQIGYIIRLTERKISNRELKYPNAEIQKIIDSNKKHKDKIEEIANFLDKHNKIGIGTPVQPYTLIKFSELKRLFSIVIEENINLDIDKIKSEKQNIFYELAFRNTSYGYL